MQIQLLPIVALLEPLYTLFGWIMRALYSVIANYGLDIIIFTVFLRLIMIPLQLKQHKTTLKQMQLTDEVNDLKRYYGEDKNGFAMAQQELFKKHKISITGGCLPSLLGLLIIWPIWRIISQPLHYIMGISKESLTTIATNLVSANLVPEAVIKGVANSDIAVLNALRTNGPAMNDAVGKGLIRADQLINLDFFGINLGMTPSFNPSVIFGEQMSTYLPLLVIPVLAVVTSFVVSRVSNNTNAMLLQNKRSKELARQNPARDVVEDKSQNMSKQMMLMMPIITLITVFTMPAAMGLYWIVGNLMMIFQSYLLYFLYTKPVMNKIWSEDELGLMQAKGGKA